MAYRWIVLAFGILAYATSQFARQNYTGVQKFIAADLQLDKAALGLLGSAFFYSYAVSQMPWGIAADKFGSRMIASLGVLLTAATMFGFSTGSTLNELFFWRVAMGIAGGAAFVAMTGGVARWFPQKERGLSQTAFGGIGGGAGESIAFFLLPYLSIYFASGWRQGMNIVAGAIVVVGILCAVFLRSAPSDQPVKTRRPFEWKLLRDPQLWCYSCLYAGFIVAIRIAQPWMAVYAADVYVANAGLSVSQAVLAGGLLTVVAYSIVGRSIGCPLAGKLSDYLLRKGVARTTLAIGWLVFAMILFQIMATGPNQTWTLAVTALFLGLSVNLFPLINAAISDTYGPEKTSSVSSFVNMFAQLNGATALALSGYMGISLNAQAGNTLTEYRGIWIAATLGVALMTILGTSVRFAFRRDWVRTPEAQRAGETA